MKTKVGYAEHHRYLPGRGLQDSVASVEVRVVSRTPANVRKRVLNRLPDARRLAERLRELALEVDLGVNALAISGLASNTDGLAEVRGTCLEAARTALLTLLSAAHTQASLPELPSRREE